MSNPSPFDIIKSSKECLKAKTKNELSELKIANEVVGIIAGLAATEAEGVAGMSGVLLVALLECLAKIYQGKVDKQHETLVDLFVIVNYESAFQKWQRYSGKCKPLRL